MCLPCVIWLLWCHLLQVTPISEDDYFTRNPEFSTWLRERRKVRAHGFVTRWTMQPYAPFLVVLCIALRPVAWPGRVQPCLWHLLCGALRDVTLLGSLLLCKIVSKHEQCFQLHRKSGQSAHDA